MILVTDKYQKVKFLSIDPFHFSNAHMRKINENIFIITKI